MERLTSKYKEENILNCGYCDGDQCNKDDCAADCPCKCEQDAINRLAAYEDTGLEPEDLRDYLPMLREWRQNAGALRHVHEMVNAETEGRLLVLPCKVGDTLWTFANYPDCYIYPFKVKDIILTGEEIRTDCVGTIRWSDIGKTVFLTHEAAEAKLKEGTRDG